MDYEYEVYIETGKEKAMSYWAGLLQDFNVVEQTDTKITLLFGDNWKLRIELTAGKNVTQKAKELAEEQLMPVLETCSTRLEITSDYDAEELYYNEHLYVLEAISAGEGAHIYDPILDEFPYEEAPERVPDPNLNLTFLDALENQSKYTHLVVGLRKRFYDVELWDELQELLYDEGNEEAALICMQNIIILDPSDYVTFYNTGVHYRDQRAYEKAEAYFRRATELQPTFPNAWADLGKLYFRKEKIEEALEYIDKALEIKPKYDLPYINASYYLVKLGEPEKALEYAEAGIKYDKYCCTFNKAHALLALGRRDDAIEFYKKGLKAAGSQQAFKSDYKADFELFKKYKLPKKEYEGLLPLILEA